MLHVQSNYSLRLYHIYLKLFTEDILLCCCQSQVSPLK